MTDMLEDIDEELLPFISDYKINLLEPKSIMDFTKFRTQLKQLFEVLQNASDKNRLQAVLQEDEQFKNMDRETVEAINLFAGMNIQTDGKEEVIDMCKGKNREKKVLSRALSREEKPKFLTRCSVETIVLQEVHRN